MTTDDRKQDLIAQAADAMHEVTGGELLPYTEMAESAFAVFEAAQKPTDDEREALAAHDAQVRAEERERAAVIVDIEEFVTRHYLETIMGSKVLELLSAYQGNQTTNHERRD